MDLTPDPTAAEVRQLAVNAAASAADALSTAQALVAESEDALLRAERRLAMMRLLMGGERPQWMSTQNSS